MVIFFQSLILKRGEASDEGGQATENIHTIDIVTLTHPLGILSLWERESYNKQG